MEQVLMTLHRFLLSWLTDEKFREDNPELKEAMENHGLADVTGEDVHQAMTLVADELPPYQAQQMGSYLNAPSGAYSSGNFNINQGGSAGAAGTGAQAASHGGMTGGYGATTGSYVMPDHTGNAPIDDAVREIQYITNNFTTINETNTTNIDDRDTNIDNSVRQAINTGGGDLDQDFVSSNVSGDVIGDGNAVGLGNTALSGDGSAFGEGSSVQSGDGNVAGVGNLGITGEVSGDGAAVGFGNQASSGIGNTTAFDDGDATSTGNIVGGDDVTSVGNQINSGDDSGLESFDNQNAGNDLTNVESDIDVDVQVINEPFPFGA
jgi:hypothetical protein